MISSKLRIVAFVLIALLGLGAILFALVTNSTTGGRRIQRLADGSTLELRQVALANGFQYQHQNDKTKIISLAVRISPALDKRRLKLLKAVDQNGNEARRVEHRNEDHAEQAFLLKPDDEATTLKLIFALQRSRFVQFLARPQFIETGVSNTPTNAR